MLNSLIIHQPITLAPSRQSKILKCIFRDPETPVCTGSHIQEGKRTNHSSTYPTPGGGVNRDLSGASFKALSLPRRVLTMRRALGGAKSETLICRMSVCWKSALGSFPQHGAGPLCPSSSIRLHSCTLVISPLPQGTRWGLELRHDQQHNPSTLRSMLVFEIQNAAFTSCGIFLSQVGTPGTVAFCPSKLKVFFFFKSQ